jgi:hypothetical protein
MKSNSVGRNDIQFHFPITTGKIPLSSNSKTVFEEEPRINTNLDNISETIFRIT